MYNREEVQDILNDPNILLRAAVDACDIAPQLKPTVIIKILQEYQTRLKDNFGIEN